MEESSTRRRAEDRSIQGQGWYREWSELRGRLRLAHSVAMALASGGRDLDDALRALGRAAEFAGSSLAGAGRGELVRLVSALREVKPTLPVAPGDDDALVRLLWWWSAIVGLSRNELLNVVAGRSGTVVFDEQPKPLSVDRLDRLMARSGQPPARSSAEVGLRRITEAVRGTRPPARDVQMADLWVPLAVERARLLDPGVAGLVAMLVYLAEDAIDLRPMREDRLWLSPAALARALESPRALAQTVNVGKRLGLLVGEPGRCALTPGSGSSIVEVLTPAERRFGAQAAIGAMAAVYPAETYRSRTWPAAKALLAHAYAAARHSEAFDVGRPHRADVLERVCIFEYEHGRMSEAADAGRRSLRAAERHRVGDWKLADILVNYASALGGLERWLEAESHFQRAIELERGNPERLAKTLNIYGDLLRKAGRPEEALEQHAEALRCAEGHPQILAEILHDQSLAFSTTRDYEKALEVLRRAENLVESGTETELLIDTRIAATLNDLERHADALAAIDRALPRIEKMWGGRSWPYVVAWHQRGIALDALAAQSGDPKLRKAAMAEYLRYRDVRDQLEAQPEGAAGAVVDV